MRHQGFHRGRIPHSAQTHPEKISKPFSPTSFFSLPREHSGLIEEEKKQNLIWGTLPDQISQLSSLKVLDLSINYLEGEIPQSLSSLSSLQVLNLGKNRFSDFITAISATLFNNLWPDSNISSLAYLSSSPKAAALSSTLVQCCLIHLWELPRHLPHPLDLSQRYCILFSISYIYF
eukprot:TRINITY_DN6805_c0_g1_i6.p1 TRINITY_DN6805_c0_g1~~TRINITY_DN6805_c0_g1_i6.p1  ORF type:complete len:176 (+),score=20.05 TRINITY_DN6805_c0_g1_i6:99-626(+)